MCKSLHHQSMKPSCLWCLHWSIRVCTNLRLCLLSAQVLYKYQPIVFYQMQCYRVGDFTACFVSLMDTPALCTGTILWTFTLMLNDSHCQPLFFLASVFTILQWVNSLRSRHCSALYTYCNGSWVTSLDLNALSQVYSGNFTMRGALWLVYADTSSGGDLGSARFSYAFWSFNYRKLGSRLILQPY